MAIQHILIIFALGCMCKFVQGAAIPDLDMTVQQVLQTNPRLFALGSVDGKAYLMDNLTRRTWTDANNFCTSAGMELATIHSQAQHDFLVSKHSTLNPAASGVLYFWLNGRVKNNISAYEWSKGTQQVVNHGRPFSGNDQMHLQLRVSNLVSVQNLASNYYTTSSFVLCEIG